MVSLLSPRRTDPAISLQAAVAEKPARGANSPDHETSLIGWLPLAAGGGVLSALTGWVLVAGIVVLGWLAADPGTLGQSLGIGTDLWLLSNGVGAHLGTSTVTVVPWGATAVFAFLVFRSAAFAARRGSRRSQVSVAAISGVSATGYLVPVVGAAVIFGDPSSSLARLAAVSVVIWLAAAWGASRARDEVLAPGWPRWTSALPSSVVGAQLTMVGAGAALLVTGLIRHFTRVAELTSALDPGIAGGVALLILQLGVAPNALIWAGSYALGAGFSVGTTSVVAPAGTEVGVLPGLPLFGVVPGNGAASTAQLWWLAAGVVAGALAAWIVVRRGPAARFDQTSLSGGLAGMLAGLVFVVLAWASGGDVGNLRLTAMGPRLLPLLVMAPTTMGLAGIVVGCGLGLLRPSRR